MNIIQKMQSDIELIKTVLGISDASGATPEKRQVATYADGRKRHLHTLQCPICPKVCKGPAAMSMHVRMHKLNARRLTKANRIPVHDLEATRQ